ncbi:MAG: hypothetical protein ACI9NT_000531 [Bacteroidia bacterium]|jgi:hypothetical protein
MVAMGMALRWRIAGILAEFSEAVYANWYFFGHWAIFDAFLPEIAVFSRC